MRIARWHGSSGAQPQAKLRPASSWRAASSRSGRPARRTAYSASTAARRWGLVQWQAPLSQRLGAATEMLVASLPPSPGMCWTGWGSSGVSCGATHRAAGLKLGAP